MTKNNSMVPVSKWVFGSMSGLADKVLIVARDVIG